MVCAMAADNTASTLFSSIFDMCLIIKKPKGRHIADDFLVNAWQRNGDGWGYFYTHQGQMQSLRGLELEDLLVHNAKLPLEVEVYLHVRSATFGQVNHEMCHPFVVREGLLLMHNGSMAALAPDNGVHSDTFELARLLRDMLGGLSDAQASAVIRSEGFRGLTAALIEGSMVVLLDAQGGVRLGRDWYTVQTKDWSKAMAGIEVSNTHTWSKRSAHPSPAVTPEALASTDCWSPA